MSHKHHIVPKHAGGTNDPLNISVLTIEEHAAAHKVLYDTYGRWQDKLAWQGLSGMITKEELITEIHKNRKSMLGKKHSLETKEKMRRLALGKRHTEETKEVLRQLRLAQPDPRIGKQHSIETKRKISTLKMGQCCRKKSVTINGILYNTYKDAAIALDVCYTTISKQVKSGVYA